MNLVICEERVVPVLIFATSDNKVYLNKLLCASDKNHAGRKHIVVESELSVLLNDCGSNCLVLKHARSRVLRFEGGNTFLGRQDFCFCYMFKTNFSGHKTTWETRKIFGGALPPNASPWPPACLKWFSFVEPAESKWVFDKLLAVDCEKLLLQSKKTKRLAHTK